MPTAALPGAGRRHKMQRDEADRQPTLPAAPAPARGGRARPAGPLRTAAAAPGGKLGPAAPGHGGLSRPLVPASG